MIARKLEKHIYSLIGKYPVISLTGPRQSGKTTLIKYLFPDYNYVNFEDIESRNFAHHDPKAFLETYGNHLIIDEAQYVPGIFSYIQVSVDSNPEKQYILTGSQNFLLLEKISQSLAGRVAILYLLPLSIYEIQTSSYKDLDYLSYIYNGGYPRIYDKNLDPGQWLNNYITTYVERDVRQILNVTDLANFQKFVSLCAGRIGQLINFSSIANELSVSYHTVQKWLSILETSFITFRLYPYYKSYNKRLVKTPKLYFYDTGLACALLGLRDKDQIIQHFLKGELFENMILVELLKYYFNDGRKPSIYFWRDNIGKEIDCIINSGQNLTAIEIKSGTTIHQDFFKNLTYFKTLGGLSEDQLVLIYGGNESQRRTIARVLSWKDCESLFSDIV